MRLVRFVTPTLLVVAAACKMGDPKIVPPAPPTEGQSIRAKEVSGGVRGADSTLPKCPVQVHYDAVLTLTKLSGKLQYRWMRSTGDSSGVLETDIPGAAHTGSADVKLKPDEWPVTTPDSQLAFTEYVHVLSPIDARSAGVEVDAKCYR